MNGNSFQYSYDGNGMRHKKVVNGATTEYYYNGTQLLAEYNKNTWEMKYYFYDQTGIAGMIYEGRFGGIRYYYFDKNTLGDVIAIRDEYGAVVAEYFYDAWGNIIYQSGSMASKNPFRYRGYYYDTETGFYYLQTRYYDPEIGRFINADNYELVGTLASIPGQLNMYAYCNNNPVMYTDESGEGFFTILVVAIMGAASAFSIEVVSQGRKKGYDNLDWGDVAIQTVSSAIFAAVSVALPGIGAVFAKAGISGLTQVAIGLYHGDTANKIIGNTLLSAGITLGLGLMSNTDITAFSKGKWVDYVSDNVFDFDLVRLSVSNTIIRYISIAGPIYLKGLWRSIG